DRDLALELGGDQLDLFIGERLRRGLHHAEAHQRLDDVLHGDAERLREVADADAGLDRDGTGRGRDRLARTLAARRVVAPAALARVAWTRRLVVDDDAPPAIAGAAAAARAERTIRFSSISHATPQCKDARVPDRPGRSAEAPERSPFVPARARSTP